jgi:hypothetical protein
MFERIDILATKLGAARPVSIVARGSDTVAFDSYPCTDYGLPLSPREFQEAAGTCHMAFFAATVARFPGRTPSAMVFGMVAGREQVLVYDRFGLAARMTRKGNKLIRKKIRIVTSIDQIMSASENASVTPLGPISGRTVSCPACGENPVSLKSFLDKWNASRCSYMQMLLCSKCAAMVTGREWLGSMLCRNCGSRVSEASELCRFCGEYPLLAGL